MTTASQILAKAKSQLGTKEIPAGSNKVKYNTEYYGQVVSGSRFAWCAVFVWWVFKECNASDLYFGGNKTAYVPALADYYINNKQMVNKNDGEPGDIVFFNWDGGRLDHVGIIEKKNTDGSYTCIEGNTAVGNDSNGGMVMRRIRSKSVIGCIARPKYTSTHKKLVVDGDWSIKTTKATQKILGTVQDGIVSGQARSCKKYLEAANSDSWKFVFYSVHGSLMVKAIQKLVGVKQDGKIGKVTVKAMQVFLTCKGFDCGRIDGYMGVRTVKAWQRYINSRM